MPPLMPPLMPPPPPLPCLAPLVRVLGAAHARGLAIDLWPAPPRRRLWIPASSEGVGADVLQQPPHHRSRPDCPRYNWHGAARRSSSPRGWGQDFISHCSSGRTGSTTRSKNMACTARRRRTRGTSSHLPLTCTAPLASRPPARPPRPSATAAASRREALGRHLWLTLPRPSSNPKNANSSWVTFKFQPLSMVKNQR